MLQTGRNRSASIFGGKVGGCGVVLVLPECRKSQTHPPFALKYLSSHLEKNGIRTRIVERKERPDRLTLIFARQTPYADDVIKAIKEEGAKIDGFMWWTIALWSRRKGQLSFAKSSFKKA